MEVQKHPPVFDMEQEYLAIDFLKVLNAQAMRLQGEMYSRRGLIATAREWFEASRRKFAEAVAKA